MLASLNGQWNPNGKKTKTTHLPDHIWIFPRNSIFNTCMFTSLLYQDAEGYVNHWFLNQQASISTLNNLYYLVVAFISLGVNRVHAFISFFFFCFFLMIMECVIKLYKLYIKILLNNFNYRIEIVFERSIIKNDYNLF